MPDSPPESFGPNERSNSDPLDRLDEILENEDFENERISYVQLESPPSKRNSTFTALRRRYPRAMMFAAVIIATAAWSKTVYECWETFK